MTDRVFYGDRVEADVTDIASMKELAADVAELADKGNVIFLRGDLGMGKTTFVKLFAECFSLDARSPSFGIVNIYDGDIRLTHMDLYRLNSYDEALGIGIEEILDDDSIKLIEWPEIIEGEHFDLDISFEFRGDQRIAILSGALAGGLK